MAGWKNMDCDPHEGVDYVGNVSDLSQFADGEADSIYASHIFEHFPHPQAPAVLKEWTRVLKPNGLLYIAVPDFKRAVEIYSLTGMTDWHRNWICGDQIYPTAFHCSIYDQSSLTRLLKGAGYVDVSRVEKFPLELSTKDCSQLVSTLDGKPLSLNLIAVKGRSK